MAQKEYYIIYAGIFINGKIRSKLTRLDVENFVTYLHIIGADDAYYEVDTNQGL